MHPAGVPGEEQSGGEGYEYIEYNEEEHLRMELADAFADGQARERLNTEKEYRRAEQEKERAEREKERADAAEEEIKRLKKIMIQGNMKFPLEII